MTLIAALVAAAFAFGMGNSLSGSSHPRIVAVAGVLVVAALAFYAGRHRRPSAVAIASATSIAEATAVATGGQATVQVFVAPADLATAMAGRTVDAGDRWTPAVPVHLAPQLSPLEQHVQLVDDEDPAELLAAYDRGELADADEIA